MKHEYTPTSLRLRALLATASVVLSTTIIGLVAGLAEHYSGQMSLAGLERPVAIALR